MVAVRPIPPDLVDFLESGISVLVGTRDAALRPDATRGSGTVIHPGRTRVTVFLPESTASRTVANLENNAQIAAGYSRPSDNLSIQIKGRAVEVRRATEDERQVSDRYKAAFVDMLYMTGLPRSLTKRIIVWPAIAITFDVTDIFVQTPGPGAGKRLESS